MVPFSMIKQEFNNMIWDVERFLRNMQELRQRRIKDAIKHEIVAAAALSYCGYKKKDICSMSVKDVCSASELLTASIQDDPEDLIKTYLANLLKEACRIEDGLRDAKEHFFSHYGEDRGLRDAMTKYASTGFEHAGRKGFCYHFCRQKY